jgi:phosphatidylglycerophosphate synthase
VRPEVAPLSQFLRLRFAARSPFWSRLVFERVGGLIAYACARLGVRPNAVTPVGGACGVAGAVLLGAATTPRGALAGGLLLALAYCLDCADGQLARATGSATAAGAWLDVTVDAVVTSFVAVSVSVALLSNGVSPTGSLLAAAAFGASRTAVLVTASQVRSDGGGGLRLDGRQEVLRTIFLAIVDTPFIYVVLTVTRFSPVGLLAVVLLLTVLSAVQVAVSARAHFAPVAISEPERSAGVERAPRVAGWPRS